MQRNEVRWKTLPKEMQSGNWLQPDQNPQPAACTQCTALTQLNGYSATLRSRWPSGIMCTKKAGENRFLHLFLQYGKGKYRFCRNKTIYPEKKFMDNQLVMVTIECGLFNMVGMMKAKNMGMISKAMVQQFLRGNADGKKQQQQ